MGLPPSVGAVQLTFTEWSPGVTRGLPGAAGTVERGWGPAWPVVDAPTAAGASTRAVESIAAKIHEADVVVTLRPMPSGPDFPTAPIAPLADYSVPFREATVAQ